MLFKDLIVIFMIKEVGRYEFNWNRTNSMIMNGS